MSTARKRLLEETRKALDRHAEMRSRLAGEAGRAPGPGDVFLGEAPGESTVEWVVLARDEDRLVMVPGDAHTLAGSADVSVPASNCSGALTLRCRQVCRVEPRQIDLEERLGVVEAVYVEQARERWQAIEAGTLTGSVLEREVDDSPEYRHWIASVVVPARHDLLGDVDLAHSEADTEPHEAGVVSLADRKGRRVFGSPRRWRAAASIALAVLAGTVVVQQWRWVEARKDASIANQVLEILGPEQETRGDRVTIVVPERASHVSLYLTFGDATSGAAALSAYRLELVETATGKKVWASSDLVREEPGELRTGIPARRLETGDYELRLLGSEQGRYRRVRKHALHIRKE